MDDSRLPPSKQSPFKGQGGYNARYKSPGYSFHQTIESDFSKRKNLKNPRNKWYLPRPENMFKSNVWENKHLILSKNELNDVKNQLSDFNLKEWHQHTRKTNHAGEVVSLIRKKISPELLTQAWCKFYEIVSLYKLVPENVTNSGCMNSLHLCEAPGAFVTSLNHFLKLRLPGIKWEWRASTLNPHYEGNKLSFMINDDRFILHTLESWEFGRDQSGDIFKDENIDALIDVSKQISPVHLVTADGSIDCQSDPGEQEAIVSPLHYCETFVALSVLSRGGSFLLKIFTMFESPTISLMYLLSCVFETVDFFKPATSKEGNSEVYVICLNFYGPGTVEPYLDLFRDNISTSNKKVMFNDEQLPLEFLCKISECSSFFKTSQVAILERNLQTYLTESSDEEKNLLFKIRKRIAYSYLERYRLEPLSLPDDFLVGNDIIRQTLTLNLDPKNEEWTFSGKKSKDCNKIENVLSSLKTQLDLIVSIVPQANELPQFCFESDHLYKGIDLKVVPVFGLAVKSVYSSKFCLGSFLHVWNRLCEIKQVDLHNTLHFKDISDKLSEEMTDLKSESLKVCDMSQVQYGGNVCFFEEECLSRLVSIIKDLSTDEDLLLVGLPLLTRVSVGIVFFVAQLFNKVTFMDPERFGYAVVFSGKRSNHDISPVFEDLLRRITDENKNDLALHSFISVRLLVKDPDWYRCIVSINQTHIRNVSLSIIEDLLANVTESSHHSITQD